MAETLRCVRCAGVSPADAQFCIECGASLAAPTTGPTVRLPGLPCPSCRTNNPENARFCAVCGRSLDVAAPQPHHVLPAAPHYPLPARPAPQQSYPRIDTRPPMIPSRPAPPPVYHARPHHPAIGAVIFLIGLFLLLTSRAFWPGILVVIGVSALVSQAANGRPDKGLSALLWLGGLAVLFATGTFWPGILFLLLLNGAINGWGRSRRWP